MLVQEREEINMGNCMSSLVLVNAHGVCEHCEENSFPAQVLVTYKHPARDIVGNNEKHSAFNL